MNPETYSDITCPHCFQVFSIPSPLVTELPTSWDYDCEVCCRPMLIHFVLEGSEVIGRAEMD